MGADDTVKIIKSVTDEYPVLKCQFFEYWNEKDLIENLRPHVDDVDMWLFSGQVPYSIAKLWGGIQKPMFYIPHTGASLYRTLLHIVYEQDITMEQLSFDTFQPSELEKTFLEAQIDAKPVFLKYYQGEISAEELSEYHYRLWQSGQTKAAVTCLRTAHLELQRLGVPVFRVLPTRLGVKEIIELILRTNETLHFKDAQIAVQMVEVDSFTRLAKDTFSTDELHRLEIKITEKLLEYAKKVHGSLKEAGPGRYVIFTTRGLLHEITENFTVVPELEESYQTVQDNLTCGIGIGKTAYEAEINAGKALLHAKEYGHGTWMILLDDKTIVGPLGKKTQITYSYASEELAQLSGKTSLSGTTINKIKAILKKAKKDEICAHELAQYMQIMPRSARRILMELEEKGFAQVIGEESPHPRGRPRKIYRILF
ncbi:transcriptional regulator [Desulfosporosinus sp. FKB]|uniref:transcriptional regulator n=1 Tax=Desulfosporosinus sp. FKB TaxID=1969835 RepID=UPI000B4A3293|nr:transcriptional regulator [Desulfosporosinus sp. FKB]